VRFVMLSNPNNPWGFRLDRSMLEAVRQRLATKAGCLIVDALYGRSFYGDGENLGLATCFAEQLESQVAVLGPAKIESMSGFRIGVVLGQPELVLRAATVHSMTSNRAPSYSQFALRDWFSDEDELFVAGRIEMLKRSRALIHTLADQVGGVDAFSGDSGIYTMLRPKDAQVSGFQLEQALFERCRLITSAGERFGPAASGWVRVCFAQDDDVLAQVMTAIGSTFAEMVS